MSNSESKLWGDKLKKQNHNKKENSTKDWKKAASSSSVQSDGKQRK